MYEYNAEVVRVVDGDTVILDIDLGMNVWMRNERIRLAGINAPELRTPEGIAAQSALQLKLLEGDMAVVLNTFKMARSTDEKHDDWYRYLGILTIYDEAGTAIDVNKWMLENNYAVSYGDLPA